MIEYLFAYDKFAMTQPSRTRFLTDRDRELLRALGRCPLTVEQLLKVSQTFAKPFTNHRYVRRRMQLLGAAQWVRRYQYHTASRGALNYYKLAPTGFAMLNGPKVPAPSKRFFAPVSPALQEHTRALADFIVHLTVAAHAADVELKDFFGENTIRLQLAQESAFPDCAFQLANRAGEHFNFLVELDAGSEPVCSSKDRESWEKKIRFYDRYRNIAAQPFRVLVVTVKNSQRRLNILRAAGEFVQKPDRTLFLGAALPDFLGAPDAITKPVFLDHKGRPQPLVAPKVPGRKRTKKRPKPAKHVELQTAASAW